MHGAHSSQGAKGATPDILIVILNHDEQQFFLWSADLTHTSHLFGELPSGVWFANNERRACERREHSAMLLGHSSSKVFDLIVASYCIKESSRFCVGPRLDRSGAQELKSGAVQSLPVIIVALPFTTTRPCRQSVGPQLESIHFGEQVVHQCVRPTCI
jgi:hypothetical protein